MSIFYEIESNRIYKLDELKQLQKNKYNVIDN